MADGFRDGAWLADLAGLADAGLVPSVVMQALGVRQSGEAAVVEALVWRLRSAELMLVLDNCEHLLDACAELAVTLLGSCPGPGGPGRGAGVGRQAAVLVGDPLASQTLERAAACAQRSGARPASPAPLSLSAAAVIEVDRMVNGCGLTCLAGTQFNVGAQLAGQRITLRMDGSLMTLIDATGTQLRTMPCPVPPAERHKLRGACGALIPARPAGPVTVARRVCCRGSIMVAKQKIHGGMIHASKTVTVTADSDHFTVTDGSETIAVVPRTTAREISRSKAYATQRSGSGEQHFGPRR